MTEITNNMRAFIPQSTLFSGLDNVKDLGITEKNAGAKSLSNAGYVQKATLDTVTAEDSKHNRNTLVENVENQLIGTDNRKPDLTLPSVATNSALLSEQMARVAQVPALTSEQYKSIEVNSELKLESLAGKENNNSMRFLDGWSNARAQVLITLLGFVQQMKQADQKMANTMTSITRDHAIASGEHGIQAAKEGVSRELANAVTTSGFAIAGGAITHKAQSNALKGQQIIAPKVNTHTRKADALNTSAVPTRPGDINKPGMAQDSQLLQQSAKREQAKAQSQSNQLEMNNIRSQQLQQVGGTLQGTAMAAGTMSSTHMQIAQAEENAAQQLRLADQNITNQQSQNSNENAQAAEKIRNDLMALAANMDRSAGDVASVIASNSKM